MFPRIFFNFIWIFILKIFVYVYAYVYAFLQYRDFNLKFISHSKCGKLNLWKIFHYESVRCIIQVLNNIGLVEILFSTFFTYDFHNRTNKRHLKKFIISPDNLISLRCWKFFGLGNIIFTSAKIWKTNFYYISIKLDNYFLDTRIFSREVLGFWIITFISPFYVW